MPTNYKTSLTVDTVNFRFRSTFGFESMKSLALNLLKTLLLLIFGVVLAAAATNSSRSSSSAVATATSSAKTLISVANRRALPTTTAIPPSLQAPPHLQLRRHTLPATAATTTTTTAKTTIQMASASSGSSSRQRLPLARHAAKQITTTTTTATTKAAIPTTSIMTNSRRKPIISETSTLDSTRLVRHIDATTSSTASTPVSVRNSGAGVRQQRSFHSNGAQPYEDTETKRKYKTLERRQYTRSYNSPSTTTTTTRKPQQHLSALRQRTATLYNGSNTPRQSKLSSLPLVDDDLKTTKTTTTTAASTSDATASNYGNAKQTTLHNQQTPKTPRMIQRLVAGHIQNAEGRSTYQVSAVTTNSTITNSTTATKISSTNSTPARHALMSSSYRNSQLKANIRVASTTASTTTTTSTSKSGETLIDSNHDVDYHDDDEALLDDPGDFDNWDNGILRLSAGSGKENNLKPKKIKEEAKKTLSDQVRDGKYGLIEKELFRRTPKRPGVLSYLPNKEVPEDNERNFGGLNEEDIWLAEDHLLVIKGGSLNEDNPEEPWPAIDDYNAAGRQIKIPSNPKVPPPFPVQLEENGPVQLIGNNKLTIVYPLSNESLPVYTIGPQTHNTPSTDDSDDEKNFITRPGKTKNAQENEPGYNYPSPALPWLYNNQTLANPSVSEGDKPVNFPVLGPFLYGRNGSLDNINGTDDFDEDDPSLYYPPAYSFVYKSNYTNRVPPGPLVPGIVVPPPPEQFGKLEKLHKEKRPQSLPIRYRISSTTSPTPTTTTITTTTTTTTELPYRQVFTKISEYTPKIINIANPSPRPVYTPTQSSRFSISPSPTPPPRNIEPVPVPVAVPIPIYSINSSPNVRPNIISFVPTTPEPNVETLSKANPIYYEYFEAKRQQGSANVVDDYVPTTSKPITVSKPIKLYATSKRPFKAQGHRNYLQPVPPNHRYVDDGGVVITPKPEIRYKSRPIFKQRPLQNFEQEVNAIRETLRYYQNQELRDNNIPRTPKAKPVFDYSYEGSKSETEGDVRNQFQPPVEYDGEPFKPMVTYSPAVNDENAFRALGVDKIGADEDQPQGREEDFAEAPKYPTTTLLPVQPQGRPKKLRIGAKYLQQPPQQQSYVNAPQRQPSWLAVNKQEFNEYVQAESPPQRERYQDPVPQAVPVISTRNREYPGYYYSPGRQNNRFYEEPFQNIPSRKIINYRPQQQHQQPQPLPPQQQQPIWSLENDTLVNELPNRPPINPDAEFIDPYLVGHHSINGNYPYQQQQQQQQPQQQQRLVYQQQPLQRPPPPISHQSQYYARPQRIPGRQYQQQIQQQQHLPLPPPPPFSLQNDELVNYRQPLPPINPDSEWITHPNVIRNQQQQQQFFRSNNYRLPPPPQPAALTNVGGEADVYYLSPKYRRANNLNNNNNSNNRFQQQQQQQQQNNGNGK
ncbi:hypothetical protein FF38_13920 [Lucilia cuprina]|uniref:Uncharacterized protein n=1 Tax=Lucilia cuprina TaxID=7375 RepID=A0A0L0BMH6_LUCCU|nr:hypothetical protein FF38_13920 [Lucilia cuprina]